MPPRSVKLLAGITAAAAALRFSTLDVQSYWFDEATTVHLLRMDLGGMLGAIPDSESTPPLYYVVAWFWAKLFGLGEVGLRSLSALVGTLTVPVVYALTARVASDRAGLVAAALAAANPLLVWYSQEARAYALLVLLCALVVLLTLELLARPRGRALAAWAVVAVLALATHYFAIFLVGPAALWLLLRRRDTPAVASVGAVALAGIALAPLALAQADGVRADFIDDAPLVDRMLEIPKQFLVGYDAPASVIAAVVAGLLAVYGVWLLVRRVASDDRRRARTLAALGAVAVGVPALLAIAGVDYLITRNVIAAWVPLFGALAIGFAATRAGRAAALALCAIGAALTIAINFDTLYQRDNWRDAAAALPPLVGDRALVVTPVNGLVPLEYYLPGSRPLRARTEVTVGEVAAIGIAPGGASGRGAPPRPERLNPPPGFTPVRRVEGATYTVVVYRAQPPQRLIGASLYGLGFDRFSALALQSASP